MLQSEMVTRAYFIGYCANLDTVPSSNYSLQEATAFTLGRYHRLILKRPILVWVDLKKTLEEGEQS